ncbi:MAG: C4-dicarboxylate TRAP transporter substrate-binding protein [Bacteroidota bacterium]
MGAGHPMGTSGGNYVLGTWFAETLAERIKETTGDDVKWTFAWGGSVAGVGDEVEALQKGVLTVAPINYMFETSKLPMGAVWYQLPFSSPDIHLMNQIAYDLHQDIPFMQEALEEYNIKYIGNSGWDSYELITTFPINKVEDLKERKIAGAGPNLDWIKAAGAVPVQASLMEVYTSLSTGVFEGYISALSWMPAFGFHEPAKHVTLCGFGSLPGTAFGMNLKVFNSLPEKIQNIVLELGSELHIRIADLSEEDVAMATEEMKGADVKFYQLPEEQKTKWAENMPDFPLVGLSVTRIKVIRPKKLSTT